MSGDIELSLGERLFLLERVGLFSKLRNEELAVVAENSEVLFFNGGTVIFNEESRSQELYVVREGEVLITRHLDNDEEINAVQGGYEDLKEAIFGN